MRTTIVSLPTHAGTAGTVCLFFPAQAVLQVALVAGIPLFPDEPLQSELVESGRIAKRTEQEGEALFPPLSHALTSQHL